MDRQPTLEGERLLLRPLRADDWDALYAVASDPLVWELHPAHDRWQEGVFRKFFAEAMAQRDALIRENPSLAGTVQVVAAHELFVEDAA